MTVRQINLEGGPEGKGPINSPSIQMWLDFIKIKEASAEFDKFTVMFEQGVESYVFTEFCEKEFIPAMGDAIIDPIRQVADHHDTEAAGFASPNVFQQIGFADLAGIEGHTPVDYSDGDLKIPDPDLDPDLAAGSARVTMADYVRDCFLNGQLQAVDLISGEVKIFPDVSQKIAYID